MQKTPDLDAELTKWASILQQKASNDHESHIQIRKDWRIMKMWCKIWLINHKNTQKGRKKQKNKKQCMATTSCNANCVTFIAELGIKTQKCGTMNYKSIQIDQKKMQNNGNVLQNDHKLIEWSPRDTLTATQWFTMGRNGCKIIKSDAKRRMTWIEYGGRDGGAPFDEL